MEELTLAILALGVFMGTLIFIIPIAGLTLRFAIKPAVESIASAMVAAKTLGPDNQNRLDSIEEQLSDIQDSLRRLTAADEFDRQLTAGSQETGPQETRNTLSTG